MDFEIPLPPLPIQLMIVERWTKAKENIVSIEGNISKLELQAKLTFLHQLGIKIVERKSLEIKAEIEELILGTKRIDV